MPVKLFGAILVIIGCGSFGFMLAATQRAEERSLRELIRVLDLMECELQYRLTPLSDLFSLAANATNGELQRLFGKLNSELENQLSVNAEICMGQVIRQIRLTPITQDMLKLLGSTLGCFDSEGQQRGLQYVRAEAQRNLKNCMQNNDTKLRSYQTLALCAGAAIVIICI